MGMWDLYEQRLHAKGQTERDISIAESAEAYLEQIISSPSYCENAKVNGVTQRLQINQSDNSHKASIDTMPYEQIYAGDIVENGNDRWIITGASAIDFLNKRAEARACNYLLKFQTPDGVIHESYICIDKGQYASTLEANKDIATLNRQYKIYAPYNDSTKYLYIDQRIALGTQFDSDGKEILLVFKITSVDATTSNYFEGDKLLELRIKSDEFNRDTDNVELAICDYFVPTPVGDIYIDGSKTIRQGGHKSYTLFGYDKDDYTLSVEDSEMSQYVHYEYVDNILTINVVKNIDIIGKSFKIIATNSEGIITEKEVEVTAF